MEQAWLFRHVTLRDLPLYPIKNNNQDAHANGFVAALNDETKMGFLHAPYGDYSLSVILLVLLLIDPLYSQV